MTKAIQHKFSHATSYMLSGENINVMSEIMFILYRNIHCDLSLEPLDEVVLLKGLNIHTFSWGNEPYLRIINRTPPYIDL